MQTTEEPPWPPDLASAPILWLLLFPEDHLICIADGPLILRSYWSITLLTAALTEARQWFSMIWGCAHTSSPGHKYAYRLLPLCHPCSVSLPSWSLLSEVLCKCCLFLKKMSEDLLLTLGNFILLNSKSWESLCKRQSQQSWGKIHIP